MLVKNGTSHPERSTKVVVQVYLQHIYANSGGSLNLIMKNGKELKRTLSESDIQSRNQTQILKSSTPSI